MTYLNKIKNQKGIWLMLCFLGLALLIISPISCSGEKLLASVGEYKITEYDLKDALQNIPERKHEKYRMRVLDNLIEVRVFSEEAKRLNLQEEPDVKADLQKIEDELLAQFFIEGYIIDKAKPTELEIKNYYEANPDAFTVPEGVNIQHLVYKKRVQAENALKKLRRGQDFEYLAKRRSLCKCWKKGGTHGWLYKGKMDPHLEEIVFKMEPKTLSGVIKTSDGYEIVRVIDKSEKRMFSFDEAKSRIQNQIFQQRKEEIRHKYYTKAEVKLHPKKNGILATIKDEVISEKLISSILAKCSEDEKDEVRKRWAKYYVELKLFSKEARKAGLQNDKRFKTELTKKVNRRLSDAFRKRFVVNKLNLKDNEIEEFYQSNLDNYTEPTKFRVKSILVKEKEEAQQILKKLQEGESFGSLAIERSLHPMAKRRAGEIGWFSIGQKDPDFEKVVLAMKKGEISKIVETNAGYEILKLIDIKAGRAIPFEQVKYRIKIRLKNEKLQKIKEQYYSKAEVKIFCT